MEYWRRGCRMTKMEKVTNKQIKRTMEQKDDIMGYIKEKRLTWYGHVRRANNNTWIKKATNWSPMGGRKKGRPHISWKNEVEEAMERHERRQTMGRS